MNNIIGVYIIYIVCSDNLYKKSYINILLIVILIPNILFWVHSSNITNKFYSLSFLTLIPLQYPISLSSSWIIILVPVLYV